LRGAAPSWRRLRDSSANRQNEAIEELNKIATFGGHSIKVFIVMIGNVTVGHDNLQDDPAGQSFVLM